MNVASSLSGYISRMYKKSVFLGGFLFDAPRDYLFTMVYDHIPVGLEILSIKILHRIALIFDIIFYKVRKSSWIQCNVSRVIIVNCPPGSIFVRGISTHLFRDLGLD